jgi:hypothetical protein
MNRVVDIINPEIFNEVARDIAPFSVGFMKLSMSEGIEDSVPAGSGTFVSIGPIAGILTAAHVLHEIPETGKIGLVRFNFTTPDKTTIDLGLTDRVVCGKSPFSHDGPDLAFLKLSRTVMSGLEARSSALNLLKRRDGALGDNPSAAGTDVVVGVIAERTVTVVNYEQRTKYKNIKASLERGLVGGLPDAHGMDLAEFKPNASPDYPAPETYKGMSGGGWWRIDLSVDENMRAKTEEKRLLGVAFYESGDLKGVRSIICHGPKSVYKVMIDAVQDKWPHEFA